MRPVSASAASSSPGGEKQQVAIARALLKNRHPDLRRSHLGARLETEKAIQAQLEEAAEGGTALVIAQRLSTVMNADGILVLDQARIVRRGAATTSRSPGLAPTRRCGRFSNRKGGRTRHRRATGSA